MSQHEARFFATQADFRKWLERHHESETELLVGFYKVGSGRASLSWPESVDQALCFGWIDGVRRRIDELSYSIRFTPRKRGSKWSDVNLAKAEALMKGGLMMPAGLAAWERRVVGRRAGYSYEENAEELSAAAEKEFRAHPEAWDFFCAQAPSYRKRILHWLTSGKKEETRQRRLCQAIAQFEQGRRLE